MNEDELYAKGHKHGKIFSFIMNNFLLIKFKKRKTKTNFQ